MDQDCESQIGKKSIKSMGKYSENWLKMAENDLKSRNPLITLIILPLTHSTVPFKYLFSICPKNYGNFLTDGIY
jgi:hypothetical protein